MATPSRSAALRNFYNLPPPKSSNNSLSPTPSTPESQLQNLLATSSASALLTAENSLVEEMRSLDADRKALVYDNYSKLIGATETIRRMTAGNRGNKGQGEEVMRAVEHIEEVAGRILRDSTGVGGGEARDGGKGGAGDRVVKWVKEAPERVESLKEEGKEEEARRVLTRLEQILSLWEKKGIDVGGMRKRAEEAEKGLVQGAVDGRENDV